MSQKAARRLRVIIDLDGVIANFDDSARALLKQHRSVDVPPSKGWDHLQSYCSDDDWTWLWSTGIDLGLFRSAVPYAGAEPALKALDHLVDMAFVTSRPPAATSDTLCWLGQHRFPVRELHIVHDRQKSDILPQANVYIDDAPHVIEDLRKNTYGTVICFGRPWNRDVVSDSRLDVHRINDWRSIVEFIRQRVKP